MDELFGHVGMVDTFRQVEKSPGITSRKSSLKCVRISLTHWVTRPVGATTRTRSISPRILSSRNTSPASIVLPSPTSSARRTRVAGRSAATDQDVIITVGYEGVVLQFTGRKDSDLVRALRREVKRGPVT